MKLPGFILSVGSSEHQVGMRKREVWMGGTTPGSRVSGNPRVFSHKTNMPGHRPQYALCRACDKIVHRSGLALSVGRLAPGDSRCRLPGLVAASLLESSVRVIVGASACSVSKLVVFMPVFPAEAGKAAGALGLDRSGYSGGWQLFAGMPPAVLLQVARLRKGPPAVLPGADKGFFSGVAPCVCSQIAALGKGLSTALMRADEGFFSAVDPGVQFQARQTGKGLPTAIVRAEEAFFLLRPLSICVLSMSVGHALFGTGCAPGRL